MIIKTFLFLLTLLVLPISIYAWDGYDYENGANIEIGKGNLVRSGQEIEIYDYSTGTYKDVEVESINGSGSGTEIDVHDSETGEHITLEME